MRIDKVLWYLRLAKSRSIAQAMAQEGHIRLNGRRIERAHQPIVVGDVLTLAVGSEVRVLELLAIPVRRGPAPEARSHYRVLDGTAVDPIAAAATSAFQEGFPQP
ncbi:RNA-binding S4 domain-containing protein [Novosphingobium sp. 9U]|uniref:RNA-binding S4 domain-containing protein n=1 Tax=Novosphingobium sp. 9U TaxID=2653158 RepID=UPI0012F42774|nr:RNA-binding S4 domain-containing protein [Novosphingobium sp. 9U]VWX53752.1 Ribosome-associated heat shock protein implicated in the recycling of the 50S subunit (S4 paralog) [Novosphingobium sp. 9U]